MASKPGYRVTGWYTDEALTKRLNPGGPVPETDVTLYPKYEPIMYKVEYSLPEGVNSRKNPRETWIGAGLMRLYPPASFENCFKGWYLNGRRIDILPGGITEDLLIEGRFCKKPVLSFRTGTRLTVPDMKTDDFGNVTLPKTPIRPGYDFIGWSRSSSQTDLFNPKGPIFEDLVLYAVWKEHRYPITLHLQGGILSEPVASEYTIDSPTILLPRAVKNGARFKGWVDARGNYRTMIRAGSMGAVELWAAFDEPYVVVDPDNLP